MVVNGMVNSVDFAECTTPRVYHQCNLGKTASVESLLMDIQGNTQNWVAAFGRNRGNSPTGESYDGWAVAALTCEYKDDSQTEL